MRGTLILLIRDLRRIRKKLSIIRQRVPQLLVGLSSFNDRVVGTPTLSWVFSSSRIAAIA